jgi:hypothetical protein
MSGKDASFYLSLFTSQKKAPFEGWVGRGDGILIDRDEKTVVH